MNRGRGDSLEPSMYLGVSDAAELLQPREYHDNSSFTRSPETRASREFKIPSNLVATGRIALEKVRGKEFGADRSFGLQTGLT